MLLAIDNARLEIEQSGSGPDLVLLHSLLADHSAFDRVASALERSFRLCRVNLPGYGRSFATASTIEDYADLIAAMIAALGLPADAAVLGNGFGGFIALALAIRHGGRFGPLIVADSLATFSEEAKEPFRRMAQAVRTRGMGAVLEAAVNRMFPPQFIAAHPDIVAERKANLAAADPESFARACLALAALDLRRELVRIGNRTLVIAGALDRTTPAEEVRALAEAIPGARFVAIAGCGHCPQIEKPAEFAAAVREFLLPRG